MIAVLYTDHGMVASMERILSEARRPSAILKGCERGMQNLYKKHFRTKDQNEPNRLGGKRQHFWLQVMQAMQPGVINPNAGTITIAINHPAIAQKVLGGTITAKRGKYLAIPQSDEAYGRAPAIFEQETGTKLFLIVQHGTPLLVRAIERSQSLQVEYVLRHSVTQQKDPTALPDDQAVNDELVSRAEAVLARQISEDNSPTPTDT